jgi:2,3-dimethylmalate lyase
MTASALRRYLADGESRVVAGCYDALTAKIAESSGFEIVYLSGYGAAAANDVGLATMTEMVESCRRICDAVAVPVIADADTGYGNALNVRRTVRAFEAAGASGLHLEDQTFPKRCGHMAGKSLISAEEMIANIRVASDARRDDDLVLIARTDAIAVEGIDAAIDRARAYRAAGADVVFVDAPETLEQIERIAADVEGPLLFDWSYGGVTPPISRSRLAALGYALVVFPDAVAVVHRAMSTFFARLRGTENLSDLDEHMTPFDALNDFVGLGGWLDLAG